MTPVLPVRGAECPPAVELERVSVGEASAASAHVASCASCGSYVKTLQDHAQAFVRSRPAERFVEQVRARSATPEPRGRLGLALFAMASAAAVVVFVMPSPRAEGVLFKGSLLSVTVKRGEKTAPLGADEALHADDALRFGITAPHDGYAAVLEKDAKGEVTVVAPFSALKPAQVHAGANTLPDSAVLDATTGKTLYVAVYRAAPFDLRLLVEQLYVADTVNCTDCTVEVSTFDKVP